VITGVVPDGDLALVSGRIMQRPPAYSAVKVGGRRAYALARAGEAVELAARSVEVGRFEETWRSGDRRGFVIECSSGTYVRSLIADLGDAYCLSLRRTGIGPFDVGEADDERLIGLGDALAEFMPEHRLGPDDARRAGHGVAVPGPGSGSGPDSGSGPGGGAGVVRLTDSSGGLIAVAEPGREPGTVKPVVGLRPGS
jgi:tRNA pseudouridine55 synthase